MDRKSFFFMMLSKVTTETLRAKTWIARFSFA